MRRYSYVGPAEIRDAASHAAHGAVIRGRDDLRSWCAKHDSERSAAGYVVATFVVDLDHQFRLAERRSEHVACAGGSLVYSAGEVTFDLSEGTVVEITNQSTGYCPEPESWPAVAAALERAGISHPGSFTTEVLFRRCPSCDQRNLVKDQWYFCEVCGNNLPLDWNFDQT